MSTIGTQQDYPKGQERKAVPVDFWPGQYVVMDLQNWESLKAQVEELKKQAGIAKLSDVVYLTEFEVPDSGPRVCPHCGMDFWQHRSRCRMLYADPDDPEAEY